MWSQHLLTWELFTKALHSSAAAKESQGVDETGRAGVADGECGWFSHIFWSNQSWAGLRWSRSLEKFGAMVTAKAAGEWKQDCSDWITSMCLCLFLSVCSIWNWSTDAAFLKLQMRCGGQFQVFGVHCWEDGFRSSLLLSFASYLWWIMDINVLLPPKLCFSQFETGCWHSCASFFYFFFFSFQRLFEALKKELQLRVPHRESVHTIMVQNQGWYRQAGHRVLCWMTLNIIIDSLFKKKKKRL